jgi:foldase protein PrsA
MTPVRRPALLLLVAVALVASACSGGSRDIARVGDTIITLDDVAELYETPSAPAGEELRDNLFRLMAIEALREGYEEYLGRPLDQAEVDTTLEDLLDRIEADGITVGDAMGIPGAGAGMLRMNLELEVIRRDTTEAQLSDPAVLQAAYDRIAGETVVCVRHILTETEEELNAATARIEGGEELSAVAADVSLDVNTPGGDLGCSFATRYVEPFAEASLTAPVGELYYPVETQYGYHALIVDDRTEVTLEIVTEDPTSFITSEDQNTLWTGWFNDVLQAADAEVLDEEYGTWTPVGVAPPEGE